MGGRLRYIKVEVQRLHAKSNDDDKSILDLQSQLRQETATLASKGSEIVILQKEIADLKKMPTMNDSDAKQEVQRGLQQIQQKESEIIRLTQEINHLQDRITQGERKNRDLEDRIRDNDREQIRHVSSRSRQVDRYPQGGQDNLYDVYGDAPSSGRDGDAHEDNMSMLHTEHLLTRIQDLLGPKRNRDRLVDDLVGFFLDHIKRPTERRALLKKMMPGHSQDSDVSNKEFGKWLLDKADVMHS